MGSLTLEVWYHLNFSIAFSSPKKHHLSQHHCRILLRYRIVFSQSECHHDNSKSLFLEKNRKYAHLYSGHCCQNFRVITFGSFLLAIKILPIRFYPDYWTLIVILNWEKRKGFLENNFFCL